MYGGLVLGFALSMVSSCVLTALARRLAPMVGLIDRPDGKRKLHRQPTPLLGGVAVYLGICVTCLCGALLNLPWLASANDGGRFVCLLLATGGAFCLIGLADDKWSVRPRHKLLLQVLSCLPFVLLGRSIHTVEFFGASLQLGFWGVPFTVLWLIACANVVNLVDGLDGLASTICLIAAMTIATIAIFGSNFGAAGLAIVYAGAVFGFLIHNWPPAKIFLGDAGSLLIGFFVGALSMENFQKTAMGFTLVMPLVFMSVPIFDTVLAIIRRKLNGRKIAEPDHGHIHHQLRERGLSRAQTLLVLSTVSLMMGMATIVSAAFKNDVIALAACVAILLVLVVSRVFAHQETSLFVRHVRTAGALLADAGGAFRSELVVEQLRERNRGEFGTLRKEVNDQLAGIGGVDIELTLNETVNDHVMSRETWTNLEPVDEDEPMWHFRYSLPREKDLRATLVATGTFTGRHQRHQLVELFRIMEAICHYWPVHRADELTSDGVEKTSSPEDPVTLPFTSTKSDTNEEPPTQKQVA